MVFNKDNICMAEDQAERTYCGERNSPGHMFTWTNDDRSLISTSMFSVVLKQYQDVLRLQRCRLGSDG